MTKVENPKEYNLVLGEFLKKIEGKGGSEWLDFTYRCIEYIDSAKLHNSW